MCQEYISLFLFVREAICQSEWEKLGKKIYIGVGGIYGQFDPRHVAKTI